MVQAVFDRALELHQQGRLAEAEQLYHQVLRQQPGHFHALHLLGVIALQTGHADEAVQWLERAIAVDGEVAETHSNQAVALQALGRFADSLASCDRAVALRPEYAEAHYNRGIALQHSGRLDEALESYQRAIVLKPDYPEAHYNRAIVLSGMARYDEAISGYDQTLGLRPDYVGAHCNRGVALNTLGRREEAVASFDRAISLQPGYAEAHSNRAVALLELNRPSDALVGCDLAIAFEPGHARAHNNRGVALRELGRLAEAIASYDRAIALQPDFAEAYSNRGAALQALKRPQEALSSCDQAITLDPEHAKAHFNRGVALQELGRHAAAVASYDRAIELAPADARAHYNRGVALQRLDRYEDALVNYSRAIALQPANAEAHYNQGTALQGLERHAAALDSYLSAAELQPNYAEPHMNRSLCLLKLGDLRRGWEEYEWRWKGPQLADSFREFPQPLWLGERDVAGKTILLHAEQGFGDILQFCRYALLVAERGARVILEVPAALVRLMHSLSVGAIVAAGDPLPAFDLHCPLLSLPLAFQTIPAMPAYLAADPAQVSAWRKRLAGLPGRRMGLVWAGGARHDSPEALAIDRRRSMPLRQLAPLATSAEVSLVSLQKGEPALDMLTPPPGMHVHDFTDELDDFADTAALVAALDLVISVDTAVAHLAGALGKPVWILNRFDSCWRWLMHRSDSPWYPTARLFRQPAPGDWDSVVADVRAALQEWCG